MSERGQLSAVEFGKRLIETGDLDPVYIAMWNCGLEPEMLKRWTIAWMCYYHCGLSCVLIEGNFFKNILRVAKAKKYPRGSQRVHHRGPPAIKSAQDLKRRFDTGTDMMDWIEGDEGTARAAYNRACSLEGFGPCMGWRIPDIGERLDFMDVEFVDRDVDLMYGNPVKGALAICERYGLDQSDPLMSAHLYLMDHLGHMDAPPRYERKINLQETETVFCKWKSHIVGRYEVGRDTLRANKQFRQYHSSPLSRKMLGLMPKGPFDA